MACHAIVLATKGIIFNPNIIIRNILPLNFYLEKSEKFINLKNLDIIKINFNYDIKNLNLVKLPKLQINKKLSTFKLNLKKCEE